MKSMKKVLITTALTITLVLGMAVPAHAASSGSWNIRYIPSAPSSVSNQTSTILLDYYSGGYYAYCDTITGTNGRSLTITSSSAGGMSSVPITSTGKSKTWKMYSSTTGTVTFKVMAASGYSCTSTGTIHINK